MTVNCWASVQKQSRTKVFVESLLHRLLHSTVAGAAQQQQRNTVFFITYSSSADIEACANLFGCYAHKTCRKLLYNPCQAHLCLQNVF